MFSKGVKWNWTASVSLPTLLTCDMQLRKGNSGGRGSLECLNFSPSWFCGLIFGLFALERVSVCIFQDSWGNLLKELFCEITLCKRGAPYMGQGGLPALSVLTDTSRVQKQAAKKGWWQHGLWSSSVSKPPRPVQVLGWVSFLGHKYWNLLRQKRDLLHICHIHVILKRVYGLWVSVNFTLCHLQPCTELTRMWG